MTNKPLGHREWEGLEEIARWDEAPYKYRPMTMLKLEERGMVKRIGLLGNKTLVWDITDAGRDALKERRAP